MPKELKPFYNPGPGDVIKERQSVSCKDRQMTVFDFMEGKK